MAQQTKSLSRRFIDFLGSHTFFWLTVGLFVAQAVWIAFSARYPQAFDEQFHLGIIKIYAHHLSPFLASQPPGADAFGAVARDPSYLYQYLMSFPYRLVSLFTNDLTIQVICLRLINVALLASSLLIFRRVLRYTGASKALVHTSLFFIVLTPVVPLLGSQINYDNMAVPLTGIAVWWTLRFMAQLRQHKSWNWHILAQLAIVCVFTSIVKYAFLPVFFAIFFMFVVAWFKSGRKLPLKSRSLRQQLKPWQTTLYVALIVLGSVLFLQRFGVNLVRYHTPIPECDQVLSISRCQANPPWARNYMLINQHVHLTDLQVVLYPFIWLYHSMGELVFTISSNFNDLGTVDYHAGSQLIIIEVISWGILGVGAALSLLYFRTLWRVQAVRIFLIISLFYIAALGAQNMLDYLHIGYPVAIHGRYLLPVLPLLYIIVAMAFRQALTDLHWRRLPAPKAKASLAAGMMVLLLFEGGGFVTYIFRSDPSWFWPQSSKAQTVNSKARTILKHTVVDIKPKNQVSNQ